MNLDEVVAVLASINDRTAVVAFLTPLRLPVDLPEHDKARLTDALVAAASRCWKGRTRVSG
jgi:hypothetical protein